MLNVTIIAPFMTKNWSDTIKISYGTHRNRKVIFCEFPYDPSFLKEFKLSFPSAKWSRSNVAWYVPDSTLYRNRLGLVPAEVGDNWLPKLHGHNKVEFLKFRDALTLKAFSPNTINTYLSEFAQLLILLNRHPIEALTSDRLNSYFLYCIKKFLVHDKNL